ncbi:hypothetical protein MACH24_13440 [Erythrobacter sp. Dej080120_24]|uniref:hypothetical protein n=1 Tax=Erythrobacter sp. Dej080120_24 TaxID=3024837 RepID=UPI00291E4262|nr:hypothetical protein MACH24_13440 [Erythrobacter sp. Dej080120_24]
MTLALRMIAGAIAPMALAAPAAAEHLEPRNACSAMAGADEFRMTLVTAVANRDAEMLQTVVDPDILLDFGGGSGWREMRARLDAADYRLWDELDTVIRLGCDRAYQDSLVMPYYWGQDFGDMDAYGTYIVLGADVPMFATAKGESRIARLRWEAVEAVGFFDMVEGNREAPLWEVQTRNGKRGFVDHTLLRALVDYRLIAEQRDGGWKITTFVAGD